MILAIGAQQQPTFLTLKQVQRMDLIWRKRFRRLLETYWQTTRMPLHKIVHLNMMCNKKHRFVYILLDVLMFEIRLTCSKGVNIF